MFFILKLNHWRCPLVLESTLINKSYYFYPTYFMEFMYLDHRVEIARLEKWVKMKAFFGFPMLTTKRPLWGFNVLWRFDMTVWKYKILVIPSIISVLIFRTQITQFCLSKWFFEKTFYYIVIFRRLENDGYRWWQLYFRLPTKSIFNKMYPVTISGYKEYFLSLIYWGGGILNFIYYLWAVYTFCFTAYVH